MLIQLTKNHQGIPVSLRSKQHRQERRNRLHQAARRHIARNGVQGLQLKELAKELGYTAPALYRYYPSKEALIVELQKETLHIMHHALHLLLTHFSSSSPLFKLMLCTRFYVAYAENSPASFALNNSVFASTSTILDGEDRKAIIQAMNKVLLIIQDQINLIDIQDSSHAFTLTMSLWSALHGVLLTKKYQRDFPIPCPHHLVDTLLLGWGIPKADLVNATKQIDHQCNNTLLTSFTSLDTKDSI